MIVETTANKYYRVWECGMDHAWQGIAVKRANGEFVPKSKAKEQLVRKAGCKVIA